MLIIKIMRLIDYTNYEIPMTSELEAHFADPFNYTREIMDQFEHDYYKGIVEPGDTLLDIGANIGLFALHVSPFFKRIICVEPTPSHFAKLKQVIPNVEYEPSALAGYTGEATFYWCGINTTMNSLQNRGDVSMQAPCITLADLVVKYGLDSVDFCKIDIEGSEDMAVTVETMRPVAARLRKVFIELHPPNGESQDRFTPIFEAVGYKVEKYVHDSLICTR